jgi:hypothetical protein
MNTTSTFTPLTAPQYNLLSKRFNYSSEELQNVSKEEGSTLIDACIKAGHKLDGVAYEDFRNAEANEDRTNIEARGILLPTITDGALNKLFEGMTPAEKDEESEMRQELKHVNTIMIGAVEHLGRVLSGYKKTIARGLWLPFLNVIQIKERSAQRYMELANIRQELGSSAIKALERKGVNLSSNSGHFKEEEAKKIAQKVIEKRQAYLDEPNTSHGDVFDESAYISQEQDEQFIAEAVSEIRQPERDSIERIKNIESEPPLEQRIRMWEQDLKDTMKALRAIYNNDTAFNQTVARICKEVVNG